MSGGGSGGNTTQSSGPPQWAVPGIATYFQELSNLLAPGGKPAPYAGPNQQVAPFSPYQQQALAGIGGLTGGTQGDVNAALKQQTQTAQGQYLDPNNPFLKKYLDSQMSPIVQEYQTAIAPSIAANAEATGTLGGSNEAQNFQLANYNLATALGNVGASTYETERGLQQQAAQNLPQQAAGAYLPQQELLAAGGQQQQQGQNVLNTGFQNAMRAYQWPYQELSALGQGMSQFFQPFGTLTTSTPGGK